MKTRNILCILGLCLACLWTGCGPDITADDNESDLVRTEETSQDPLTGKNDAPEGPTDTTATEDSSQNPDSSKQPESTQKSSSSGEYSNNTAGSDETPNNAAGDGNFSNNPADNGDSSLSSQASSGESSPEDSGFYKSCTSFPSNQVESFAQTVKSLVTGQDWEGLSELISYPVKIDGAECQTPSDFLALDFENRLNPGFLSAIEAESCHEMFFNWQGISMGAGSELWFGEVYSDESNSSLLVTGFNGLFSNP